MHFQSRTAEQSKPQQWPQNATKTAFHSHVRWHFKSSPLPPLKSIPLLCAWEIKCCKRADFFFFTQSEHKMQASWPLSDPLQRSPSLSVALGADGEGNERRRLYLLPLVGREGLLNVLQVQYSENPGIVHLHPNCAFQFILSRGECHSLGLIKTRRITNPLTSSWWLSPQLIWTSWRTSGDLLAGECSSSWPPIPEALLGVEGSLPWLHVREEAEGRPEEVAEEEEEASCPQEAAAEVEAYLRSSPWAEEAQGRRGGRERGAGPRGHRQPVSAGTENKTRELQNVSNHTQNVDHEN